MGRIRESRPSPAMIVAVVALVAALTGTAVAELATTAKLDKKEKKQVRKITKKQINKLASGLSVASADSANSANSSNTANSANQAQNAVTANGVRPVKVSFAASPGVADATFVNQGGVRITGHCDSGPETRFEVTSTADDGLVKFDAVDAAGTTSASEAKTFNSGVGFGFNTGPPPNDVATVTVTYRGAGGTEVSGEVVIAEGAAAAQCVIAGTLFVG